MIKVASLLIFQVSKLMNSTGKIIRNLMVIYTLEATIFHMWKNINYKIERNQERLKFAKG